MLLITRTGLFVLAVMVYLFPAVIVVCCPPLVGRLNQDVDVGDGTPVI